MALKDYFVASTKRLPLAIKIHAKISNQNILRCIHYSLAPFGVMNSFVLYAKSKLHVTNEYKYRMAVVAIVKDEMPYITEWIEYYRLVGIDHIFVYDNGSTDGTREELDRLTLDGFVTVIDLPGLYRQYDAYNDALNRFGNDCSLMAFVDADEFLFSRNEGNGESLPDVCEKLIGEDAGLVVNWSLFGSSGYVESPSGLVTQLYLRRASYDFWGNGHVKTICRPRQVVGFVNAHYCVYVLGKTARSVSGERQYGPFCDSGPSDVLRVNHYFTKSFEDFKRKRLRGNADCATTRRMSEFDAHDRNEVYDDGMLAFGEALALATSVARSQ